MCARNCACAVGLIKAVDTFRKPHTHTHTHTHTKVASSPGFSFPPTRKKPGDEANTEVARLGGEVYNAATFVNGFSPGELFTNFFFPFKLILCDFFFHGDTK